MSRVAVRNVTIHSDTMGKRSFEAGEEVPDEWEELVDNDAVWLGENDYANEIDEEDEDAEPPKDELDRLSVRQLAKLAYDRKVPMPNNAKKADILQALRAEGITSVG